MTDVLDPVSVAARDAVSIGGPDQILDDQAIYPDTATMDKLYTVQPYDPKTQRIITRTWTKIVTGQ